MSQNSVLYEEDFFAWTIEQARLLRAGDLSAVDAANIAEEIESMGRSDRRELQSRLVVLIMHLLKWRFQPSARSTSWSATIEEQRLQIENILSNRQACTRWPAVCCHKPTRSPASERSPRPVLPTTCSRRPAPSLSTEVLTRSFLPER